MIQLPKLPYDLNALEPVISGRTMSFHYGKHHAGYVDTVNRLIQNTSFENDSLDTLILTAASDTLYTALFNSAAQAWNHTFFWSSLTPDASKRTIPDDMIHHLTRSFGSVQHFKDAFKQAALSQFGSGWAWLVSENGTLKIITTSNAQTPLTTPSLKPLLCIDVWEHAYYLDYQNMRATFVQAVIDNLLNWHFATHNLRKE